MFSVKKEAHFLKKSTFEPQRPKTFRPHIDKWNGTLHTWLKKKLEDKKFDIFHTLTMTGEWGGYPKTGHPLVLLLNPRWLHQTQKGPELKRWATILL